MPPTAPAAAPALAPPPPAGPRARGPRAGAAGLVLLSTALFGTGDAVMKGLLETWAVPQVILLRSLGCLALLAALRRRGEPLVPAGLLAPANLLRAGCEVGVTFAFFAGVARLPLGDAISLLYLAPVLLTVLAATLLGERVGRRRWAAVLLGFAGVLAVARPDPGGVAWAALLPLASACCIAGRDLAVRRLPPEVSDRAVVAASSLALLLAGAASAPFAWAPVGPALLLGAAACSVTVTLAFMAYVRATRAAEVSFIQPLKYLAIPYGFLLAWAVWGDAPDAWAAAGAGLILLSGLLIFLPGGRRAAAAATGPAAEGA